MEKHTNVSEMEGFGVSTRLLFQCVAVQVNWL